MSFELINFNYQSSPVDWCENNYYFSNIICEFNNSWSSILYSIFAYYIFTRYSKFVKNNLIYGIITAGFLVGITSFLFHSTLSLAGQMLDEGSIIVFIISSDLVINQRFLLTLFFSFFLIASLFIPTYCRFILLLLGLIIIKNTITTIKSKYQYLYPYFLQTLKLMFVAVGFWIVDMVICDYLVFATHFIWHILSAIALHNLTILTILMNNKNLTLTNTKVSFYNPMYFLKKNSFKNSYDRIV